MRPLKTVIIRDETLRDGIQQAGINFNTKEKIAIATLSAQLLNSSSSSVRNQIDLGMPEISNYFFKTIQKITQKLCKYNIDFFVTGTSRPKAIKTMTESLVSIAEERKIIAPFLGISYLHRKKMSLTKLQILKKAIEIIEFSKQYCQRIHFPLEGGYHAYLEEPKFVFQLLEALEKLGVECIPFCDTVGIALPFSGKKIISYGEAIRQIKDHFPKLKISAHCHNDFGLAVANSLEAIILGGADIIDGTFLGVGERCGNTSLETLLTIIAIKGKDLGFKIEANLKNLFVVSYKIADIFNLKIPYNSPVIGKNAFSHVAGIHQDGTIKNNKTYESFKPKKIGRRGHEIVLGPLSGKKGISYILARKYHLKNIEDKILNKVTRRFKNIRNNKNLNPEKLLLKILSQVLLAERRKLKFK